MGIKRGEKVKRLSHVWRVLRPPRNYGDKQTESLDKVPHYVKVSFKKVPETKLNIE